MNTLCTPQLKHENIALRPYADEHIEMTVKWLQDPIIQQNFGHIEGISVEKHTQWLKANKDVLMWAIYDKKYVGNVLAFLNQKHHSAYLQIYLGSQEDTGKGLGYCALSAVLEYLFNELHYHRVWLHCLPENIPALKLYQKLHFVLEGMERESILKNGAYITLGRWSLLKHEWLHWSAK